MPKDPNEVGAIWKKTSARGVEYLSVSVDLEVLIALNGGVVGKVDLAAFTIDEKTKATSPDYRVKFFPKDGTRAAQPATKAATKAAATPLLDGNGDPIPF